jgi:transposase
VRRWFRPAGDGQLMLVPGTLREMLPEGHLAFQVMETVRLLDLSGMYAAYRADGQGQAPYDPAVMLGVLFYCHLKGLRSAREIAGACVDDLGCRVISGGAVPSHQAFAVFRRRHGALVPGLFRQVLMLCAAQGLVKGHTAAVDGSPVAANAAMSANMDAEKLAAQIAQLETELDAALQAWLDGWDRQPLPPGDDDDDDGGRGGDGSLPSGLPRRVHAMASRLARLQQARQVLAERAGPGPAQNAAALVARLEQKLAEVTAAQQARWEQYQAKTAAAGGKAPAGQPAVPPQAAWRVGKARERLERARVKLAAVLASPPAAVKVSTTDPRSRVMPAKNGGYDQSWNLQLTAARNQILLAVGLYDNPADVVALPGMIRAGHASAQAAGIGSQFRVWLADSGYASAANFAELDQYLLLVAVSGEAAQTGRASAPAAVPAGWEKMAARLDTPAGKKLYRRRAALVEPAFAQFFGRFGRYLSYRGQAAHTEAQFLGTVHNLAKLLRHQQRQHTRPAPAT